MAVTRSHPGDDELSAFAAGNMGQVDVEKIEAHLLECHDCGSRLDQLVRNDSFVTRMRKISEQQKLSEPLGISSTTGEFSRDTDTEIFSEDRRIGSTLGNHHLIAILGKGGMGIVYRATDSLIGRDVAIKVLHESVAGDASARSRFLAEARSQGMLNHPNVVTIYQIDELESTMFIVMELLRGGSIGDHIKSSGPLHWHEATRFLMQACRGLSAAHTAGLIHRDIKPENLLVDGEGQVKLSDFGLAKSIDAVSLTGTNHLVGTPQFMSPEQCRCETIDARSDIYQLGATYYALLTGRNPYEQAKTPLQAIDAHCRAPVPDPRAINPDLPDDCADIIAEAMAKEAHTRYQTAGELFEDLIALYGSVPATEKFGAQVAESTGAKDRQDGRDVLRRPSGGEARPRPRIAAVMIILLAAVAMFGKFIRTPKPDSNDAPASLNGLSTAVPSDALPIKVGVLHSLTGTMSGSESSVVDAVLLVVDELNDNGGLLGRPIEPIVADGRSDPLTFAREAERLISEEGVCTVFGCWTSASRKSVLPVFEEHNHLLIYPVQYEGIEKSPNVIYTGAAPNQQIIPAVQWAFAFQHKRKFFLVGSDYVFPRTANQIIKDVLQQLGGELVGEEYIPLGSYEVTEVVQQINKVQPDIILNTINGDSNTAFFRALRAAGITPAEIPTISFSIGEVELQHLNTKLMVGDYASWNYFQSIDSVRNREFVKKFQSRYGPQRAVSDPMEAAYIGFLLWAQAVEKTQSTDPDKIRNAMLDSRLQAPEGLVQIDPDTQHTYKTARIGQVQSDGQFEIVWEAISPMAPIPYPTSRTVQQWDEFLQDLYLGWGGQWWAPAIHTGDSLAEEVRQ